MTLREEWAGLPPGWRDRLSSIPSEPWFEELATFLQNEDDSGLAVFPPAGLRLRALRETDFNQVQVVILGQDPYHGPGQAIGRAFAVPNSLTPKPPSLLNILKELANDLSRNTSELPSDLSGWAGQGVLLLNTILTVRQNEPLSHSGKGWERLTDRILLELNLRERPLVFLLWGAPAQKKRSLIAAARHLVLEAPHPSPLSAYRGYFGCRHFSRTNTFLQDQGMTPIRWLGSATSG